MVQDEHLRASNDKRSWTGSLITLSNLGIFPTDVSRPPEPSGVVHVDDLSSLSAKAMMRPTPTAFEIGIVRPRSGFSHLTHNAFSGSIRPDDILQSYSLKRLIV